MLERLKARVFEGVLELFHHGLTTENLGSLSAIDREYGLIAMKPKGICYRDLQLSHIVLVDFSGNIIEGNSRPSVDIAAHVELYKAFPKANSIAYLPSHWIQTFASLGKAIPPYSTLQSRYFYQEIPCTRRLTLQEVETNFQKSVGKVIIQEFRQRCPLKTPAVLVHNHGGYTWGETPLAAVRNGVLLDTIAKSTWHTLALSKGHLSPISKELGEYYFKLPKD